MQGGDTRSKAATSGPSFFARAVVGRASGALPEADRRALLAAVELHRYDTGQVIFEQGDACVGLFAVERGTVAIRKRDREERSMIVRLVYPGQALGYRTYFSGGVYSAAAEAVDAAEVSFLPGQAVERLLAAAPGMGRAFLRQLADDLREAEDARLEAVAMPVRARLARLLLDLRDRFATVDDEGTMTISLPLGRRDIAAMLGARPETIARAVRALEDDGVAGFQRRNVVISDLDLLLDEVEPYG